VSPLNKQKGNMYPWVDRTHNFIRGECPHKCKYCYVPSSRVAKLYTGKPHLVESAFKPLGKGKTIFVGSMIDMWAEEIPTGWIKKVLVHCDRFDNTYLFQTKNPNRIFLNGFDFPKKFIVGTTIETNRDLSKISNAPPTKNRFCSMTWVKYCWSRAKTMISVEPILDCDVQEMKYWIRSIKPDFVSIGADSKGHNLPEPSPEKVRELIKGLEKFTEVKIKSNLKRLMKGER